MRHILLFIITFFSTVGSISAQNRFYKWRESVGDKYIGVNLSTTRYRGDLSDVFNFQHWQLSWGAEVHARYRFDNHWCLRSDIGVYHVRADQRYSRNAYNKLSFSATNLSANVGVQWDFRSIDYNPRNNMYMFGGLGITKLAPSTTLNGTTYSLPAFKTEGVDYGLWVGQLHYGLGVPVTLSESTQLRFEGRYTHVFSDYMDDVSTVYADKSAASDIEKKLADGRIAENLSPNIVGAKRGEPANKDGYFLLTVQFVYKFY